jgi:hypothetical protein
MNRTYAWKSPLLWFLVCLAGIAALTAVGPAEMTLGTNARVVYLHGVWVWASLAAFALAGAAGAAGLLFRRVDWQRWSRALGRTGLFFWITDLPVSVWAMQTHWKGLFLAEPRWRLAIVFAVAGLLLQTGLTLLEDPAWAAAGNLVYLVVLLVALQTTENVMHPASPIWSSDARRIQIYFGLLFLVALAAVWQVARWWRQREPEGEPASQPARRSSRPLS